MGAAAAAVAVAGCRFDSNTSHIAGIVVLEVGSSVGVEAELFGSILVETYSDPSLLLCW